MIDADKLLNFQIPDVYQEWRKRDTILYALSVGLGQNPIDEQQLDFVDQHRSLIAVPAMVVVLGYPGFWLGSPGTGVDRNSVLHGEQHIEIVRPLPVEGRLIGRTRVTDLIDKGAGNAALLLSTRTVLDAQTEEVLAVTSSTTFLRDGGGFGGQRSTPPPIHRLPDGDPDIVVDQPTRPEQALLYRLNGDDNDIHSSPLTAARAGFPRPILHGLCSFGIACHGLLRALGNYQAHRLKRMGLRFSAPVFPGETLRLEIWKDGSFRARVLERDALVLNNGYVMFDVA
jgi:acyl dehydratase